MFGIVTKDSIKFRIAEMEDCSFRVFRLEFFVINGWCYKETDSIFKNQQAAECWVKDAFSILAEQERLREEQRKGHTIKRLIDLEEENV